MSTVEERIRGAIEEGCIEDLPGIGKPLSLEENPYEDPEWRMANHVLRSGGLTLPWIEKRRMIESELDAVRIALRRTWIWREDALTTAIFAPHIGAEWKRAVELFREQISQINRRILSYNLEVPSEHFQLPQLNVEREMELTITPPSDTLPDRTTT